MSIKLFELLIVLVAAFLYIAYYFQLYKATKLSRLLLICELGFRAISSVFVIRAGRINSYWDLLHYIPLLFSIALYLTEGLVSKIILAMLSSLILALLANHIYQMFIPYFL